MWNPYSFSGYPLAANFQSAAFYPLNLLFFRGILPFYTAWSIFIFLAPILAGIFLFLYLNSLRLNKWASVLGSISFSFSGFFVSWLEWGNILHTALWLPLILLSIDKILVSKSIKYPVLRKNIKSKNYLVWGFIFTFSLISAFFAGHVQTFFYLLILSIVYFFARWFQYGRKRIALALFTIYFLIFTIATSIQWFPTLQFIYLVRQKSRSDSMAKSWMVCPMAKFNPIYCP